MIHLEQAATQLIAEWKKNGFNGVKFCDIYMQPARLDDFLGDGLTKEDYEKHILNCACFAAAPDLYETFASDDGPYRQTTTDWFKCYDDMKAEMRKRFGDDVKISHNHHCNEWTVSRD